MSGLTNRGLSVENLLGASAIIGVYVVQPAKLKTPSPTQSHELPR